MRAYVRVRQLGEKYGELEHSRAFGETGAGGAVLEPIRVKNSSKFTLYLLDGPKLNSTTIAARKVGLFLVPYNLQQATC